MWSEIELGDGMEKASMALVPNMTLFRVFGTSSSPKGETRSFPLLACLKGKYCGQVYMQVERSHLGKGKL